MPNAKSILHNPDENTCTADASIQPGDGPQVKCDANRLFVVCCFSMEVNPPVVVISTVSQTQIGWRMRMVSATDHEAAIEAASEFFKSQEPNRVFDKFGYIEINNDTIRLSGSPLHLILNNAEGVEG